MTHKRTPKQEAAHRLYMQMNGPKRPRKGQRVAIMRRIEGVSADDARWKGIAYREPTGEIAEVVKVTINRAAYRLTDYRVVVRYEDGYEEELSDYQVELVKHR